MALQLACSLLVIQIIFVSLVEAQQNAKRVNLISPKFIGAKLDGCWGTSADLKCNFTLWTRAAEYKLLEFGLYSGTTGRLIRPSETFIEPHVLDQKIFFHEDGKEVTYIDHQRKTRSIANSSGSLADETKPPLVWLMCQAMTSFDGPEKSERYTICFRDGVVHICKSKGQKDEFECRAPYSLDQLVSSLNSKEMPWKYIRYTVPITAAVSRNKQLSSTNDSTNTENPTRAVIDLIMFDATGRMIVTEVTFKSLTEFSYGDTFLWHISAFLSPIEFIKKTGAPAENTETWARSTFLMNNLSHLRDEALLGLKPKMKGTFVQAIAPVYHGLEDFNDTQIALCIENGYQITWTDGSPGAHLPCRWKGQSRTNYSLEFKLSDPVEYSAIINAFHITTGPRISTDPRAKGFNWTSYHLVYTWYSVSKKATLIRYFHCDYVVPVHPDKEFVGEEGKNVPAKFDISNSYTGGGSCVAKKISTAPSDILGIDNGACRKTVTFYDFIYEVRPIDAPITAVAKTKFLDGLNFYINAAFSLKNDIYFFTHTNTLLIYKMSMDKNCETLILDKNQVQEMYSQDFILYHAYQGPNQDLEGPPYLIDYLEFMEGETDFTGRSQFRHDHTLLIAVIGVACGALLLAGLLYLLYRGAAERQSFGPQRTKSSSMPSNILASHSNTMSAFFPPVDTTKPKVPRESKKSRKLSKTIRSYRLSHRPRSKVKDTKSPGASMSRKTRNSSRRSPRERKSRSRTPRSPMSPLRSPTRSRGS